jgi:hypothetical protein
MHPIQDLFLESFSYVLQFDMHFYIHPYVDKNFILVKSGCYKNLSSHRIILLKFLYLLFYIIYFVRIACFQYIDCRIENELPENFQDINFGDIEQHLARFEGKCP